MGLDVGDRRIGVALSDPGGILASPLTIIQRKDDEIDIKAILALIDQYEVARVIIGLPLSLNGSVGPQAEKVKAFAQQLIARTNIPVEFRDERFSTIDAQRLIREVKSRKTKDKRPDDAIAAAVILQSYLEERRI